MKKPLRITCETCEHPWTNPESCSGCTIIDQVAPKYVRCEHVAHCHEAGFLVCPGFHSNPHMPNWQCRETPCADSPCADESARCLPITRPIDRLINDLCDELGNDTARFHPNFQSKEPCPNYDLDLYAALLDSFGVETIQRIINAMDKED